MQSRLIEIYRRLLARFGPQHWWPAESAFEIIVGAILTQSTSWANVRRALDNLKQAGALWAGGLAALDVERLAALIRPSGYYHGKALTLRAFMDMLDRDYGGDVDALLTLDAASLRRVLLATRGIGPETADDIILYAANQPVFVIDAYTRRILLRLALCSAQDRYGSLQALFEHNLPADAALFNEYHALLVHLGKTTCIKSAPRCPACPLRDLCPTGNAACAAPPQNVI